MATKPEAPEVAKAPVKSKKMLLIIIGAVLVLVLGGAGAFFYISKQRAAAEGEEDSPVKAAHVDPKKMPAYLPLDNMVVNLADPGGEKVAQIGITLEVQDPHASDSVKAYLPTIRSSILMLIAQRTAEELLTPEGKEKLAKDILHQASLPFGGGEEHEDEATSAKKKKSAKKVAPVEYPVVAVLFSSFIVQ
ncbi:MAG: flagellar basal body-associated FliL family protein [Pseudomonadota bacterium]